MVGYGQMISFVNHYNGSCVQDPFETQQTRARGNWYGISGVPNTRFDGKLVAPGGSSCGEDFGNFRNVFNQRWNETGGLSPVQITGGCAIAGSSLTMSGTFLLVDPVTLTDLRATLLVYEDNIHLSGGGYYQSIWQHVTRWIYDQPIYLSGAGQSTTVTTTIALDPAWVTQQLHVVAFVQRTTGNKEIYQGAFLPILPSAVDEGGALALTGLIGARPNPFRGSTQILFSLAGGASAGPIRLEIMSVAGSRVALLWEGALPPGEHVKVWNGLSDSGARVASGMYWARLTTREGPRAEKLILVR